MIDKLKKFHQTLEQQKHCIELLMQINYSIIGAVALDLTHVYLEDFCDAKTLEQLMMMETPFEFSRLSESEDGKISFRVKLITGVYSMKPLIILSICCIVQSAHAGQALTDTQVKRILCKVAKTKITSLEKQIATLHKADTVEAEASIKMAKAQIQGIKESCQIQN